MSDRLDKLVEWAKFNGAYIDPRVSFEYSTEKGVHAIINEDINQSEEDDDKDELLKVPENILITLSLAQSVLGKSIKSKNNVNGVTQLLVAQLKFDGEKNGEALALYEKFQPYIDYLPIDQVTPYYWNSREKKLIQQTEAGRLAKIRFEEILEEWHELVTQLPSSPNTKSDLEFYDRYKKDSVDDEELFEILNNKEIKSWTSFPAYLWSSCIFYGRAFPHILIDSKSKDLNEAFLLPIVDLLNHENGHSVKWDYDSDTDKMVSFKSLKQGVLTKGSELFNNYGDKTNCELLLGYGFVLDNNVFDSVGLTLRVPNADTVLAKAKKLGEYNLPLYNKDSQSVSFKLLRKSDELPEELVVFFSLLYQLSSEQNQYTLRMRLEGLQSLRDILNQQIQLLKSTSLTPDTTGLRDFVMQQVKKYKRNQSTIYQNSIDQISRLEKLLIKTYKPMTLKTILKNDAKFNDAIFKIFNIKTYDDIISKDLHNTILILWIIRVYNRDKIEPQPKTFDLSYPDFVYHTYQDVKSGISITREDVVEYQPLYSSLFPQIQNSYPELFGAKTGDWSLRSFVIASTVTDRLVFVRKVNNDVYVLDKHLMNKQVHSTK